MCVCVCAYVLMGWLLLFVAVVYRYLSFNKLTETLCVSKTFDRIRLFKLIDRENFGTGSLVLLSVGIC